MRKPSYSSKISRKISMFHQLENKPNIAHDNLRSTNTQCLNCQLEAGKTKTLMV